MHSRMGGRLTRAVVAGLLLAAPLAACSPDDEPAAPTATLGTAPPVTPTTDPYAVPAVIDAAYVNRVLEGLDAAVGDVVRMVVREKRIPREAAERLQAIYIDKDAWQLEIDLLQRDSFQNFSSYKPDPGNQKTVVTRLITASPLCVFAEVERDYSPVGISPDANLSRQWIALKPVTNQDPEKYNITSWGYVYDGFTPNRTEPPNPCLEKPLP